MILWSKQPNKFDAFCHPERQGQEVSDASAHAWHEDDRLQALVANPGEPGADASQWVTPAGRCSPSDFSTEDLSLARKLNRLFSVEREEVPPLFVRTLAAERQDWQAPSGLIQRVIARVFRRTELSDPSRAQTVAELSQASLGEVVAIELACSAPVPGAAVYIVLGQLPGADA